MNPFYNPAFSETATGIVAMISVLLVPLAVLGLALVNNGLNRSRTAAYSIFSSLVASGVAFIVYVIGGFSWAGLAELPAHVWMIGGKPWSWIGAASFFLRGVPLNGSHASTAILLQVFAVALAVQIPLGAAVDRWRMGAVVISTALFSGITYPLFAHWVWGGGWLAQLGSNFGLGAGFVDAGGASVVHVAGGLTALCVVWILGPRHDKYSDENMPSAIPGHNVVTVISGCFLVWIGLLGLNSAGAILFQQAPVGSVILVAVNTALSASAALLTAVAITRVRFGRPDASLGANGWVSGLVAVSAASPFLPPAAALLIGIVAGGLVIVCIDALEMRLRVDDPGGAVSVHAIAGIWGLLAAGVLAHLPTGQLLAQLVGVATLLGFVLPLSYALNWAVDRIYGQRIEADGERQGMDLSELGAGAYPEFVTHTDEFIQR